MQKAIYQSLDRFLSHKSSRRDFIQAVTAVGISSLGAESMLASAQQGRSGGPGDGQADKVWISEGTAGALLVEQLKAAGVKYIFHTNTSGLATLTDAVDTPEMQGAHWPRPDRGRSGDQNWVLPCADVPERD